MLMLRYLPAQYLLDACFDLFKQRGQKDFLCVDSAEVLLHVARAETDEILRVFTVECLPPLLQVDIQSLLRVGIIHSLRHIELHTAENIHNIDQSIEIEHRCMMDIDAQILLQQLRIGLHRCEIRILRAVF